MASSQNDRCNETLHQDGFALNAYASPREAMKIIAAALTGQPIA
jgi:hypothetical protein